MKRTTFLSPEPDYIVLAGKGVHAHPLSNVPRSFVPVKIERFEGTLDMYYEGLEALEAQRDQLEAKSSQLYNVAKTPSKGPFKAKQHAAMIALDVERTAREATLREMQQLEDAVEVNVPEHKFSFDGANEEKSSADSYYNAPAVAQIKSHKRAANLQQQVTQQQMLKHAALDRFQRSVQDRVTEQKREAIQHAEAKRQLQLTHLHRVLAANKRGQDYQRLLQLQFLDMSPLEEAAGKVSDHVAEAKHILSGFGDQTDADQSGVLPVTWCNQDDSMEAGGGRKQHRETDFSRSSKSQQQEKGSRSRSPSPHRKHRGGSSASLQGSPRKPLSNSSSSSTVLIEAHKSNARQRPSSAADNVSAPFWNRGLKKDLQFSKKEQLKLSLGLRRIEMDEERKQIVRRPQSVSAYQRRQQKDLEDSMSMAAIYSYFDAQDKAMRKADMLTRRPKKEKVVDKQLFRKPANGIEVIKHCVGGFENEKSDGFDTAPSAVTAAQNGGDCVDVMTSNIVGKNVTLEAKSNFFDGVDEAKDNMPSPNNLAGEDKEGHVSVEITSSLLPSQSKDDCKKGRASRIKTGDKEFPRPLVPLSAAGDHLPKPGPAEVVEAIQGEHPLSRRPTGKAKK